MKTTSPTYMGFNSETKFWAFSPSRMKGADYVWDISDWTFDEVMNFMQFANDEARFNHLAINGVKAVEV